MKKIIAVFLLVCVVVVSFWLKEHVSLENIKSWLAVSQGFIRDYWVWLALGFFVGYTVVAMLSLPIAGLLSVTAGAIFGVGYGVLIVSFASTIGASLLFILSRYILSERIRNRFPAALEKVHGYMRGNHAVTVVALRLVPLFPFFVVNLALSLTELRLRTFYVYSQLGMLPGTIVYVNAGTQIARLNSLNDIVSPQFILSFAALGILPILGKFVYNKLLKGNTDHV